MLTRVYFSTDIHGSELCFRKFLNAGRFYDANVLILGGDITGKIIILCVEQPNSTFEAQIAGVKHVASDREELKKMEKNIRNMGYYPYRTNSEESEEFNAHPDKVDKLFSQLMIERLKKWVTMAEDRLKNTGIKIFITGGNDDSPEVDTILGSSDYVECPVERVVDIDDHHEMVSSCYSNITPWKCPRDISEEEIAKKIEEVNSMVKNMDNCVFNFHCPPYDTDLDVCCELDKDLKPVIRKGNQSFIPVGSKSVRAAIEEYQPLLGLHGHIHEGKGAARIGRTLCLNPGSEYSEGILDGVVINLDEKKIKSYYFTSG